jgi:hypothetical protein
MDLCLIDWAPRGQHDRPLLGSGRYGTQAGWVHPDRDKVRKSYRRASQRSCDGTARQTEGQPFCTRLLTKASR